MSGRPLLSRIGRSAAALLLWAALARSAAAQAPPVPLSVLVDASGSTRGFYDTGAMDELVATLRSGGADRAFSAVYRRAPSGGVLGGIAPFTGRRDEVGTLTLLWHALTDYLPSARPGEVVAFITDNIQDSGGLDDEQRDVHEFYEVLRDDARFSHVYVIPLRRPFLGPLYGRDGVSRLGTYDGERGLLVYLLAYRAVSPEPVQTLARTVAARLGSNAIRMKPYDTAPVAALVDTAATRRLPADAACDARPLVPVPGDSGILERREPVGEGQPFGGTFVVRLSSRMEGVSLDRPQVRPSIPDAFRMDLGAVTGPVRVTSDPPQLKAELAPGDTISVRLSVCFPSGLRFDTAQEVQRRLANASVRAATFEGGVRIELTIPQRDLRLQDTLRSEYSVSDPAFFTSLDPALHRRIFGLEEAFRVLAPPSVTVTTRVQDYHIRFRANLPIGGAFRRILTWLLGLLAVGALIWLLFVRSGGFLLSDEGGGSFHFRALRAQRKGRTRRDEDPLDFLEESDGRGEEEDGTPFSLGWLGSYPVRLDGRVVARIRDLPLLGPRVRASGSHRLNGGARVLSLNPAGTSFHLAPTDPTAEAARRNGDSDPGGTGAWADTWDRDRT